MKMRKLRLFLILPVMVMGMIVLQSNSAADGIPKVEKKFGDRANQMNKKGALAVVGIAVADAGRHDIGERKAIENAKQKMSEAKKQFVEASTHSFMEEVGVGKGSERNDVMRNTIESVSANLLNGAMRMDFDSYQTKENKKAGTATYLVLYVITPEAMYKSLESELNKKGSEQNLYQRYVDSEAKKEHDKKLEQFKKDYKNCYFQRNYISQFKKKKKKKNNDIKKKK